MQAANSSLSLFVQRLPVRPYATNGFELGGLTRLPLDQALTHLLIQPNTRKRHVCLCFDVDRASAGMDWDDRGAPPPNLVVKNPANGHAHLIYLLENPVSVSDITRIKPVLFLAAVQEGIRRTLAADRGYAGLVVKNPAHAHWMTTQWAENPYELNNLAEYVELPTMAQMRRLSKKSDYAGLGRNCTLFEICRTRSYSLVRDYWKPGGEQDFRRAVLDLVCASNQTDLGDPLSLSECKSIARSISGWTWKRFTPGQFREIQSARGKRKGAALKAELLPEVLQMRAQGKSVQAIADHVGVSVRTVSYWIKSQCAKAISDTQPLFEV